MQFPQLGVPKSFTTSTVLSCPIFSQQKCFVCVSWRSPKIPWDSTALDHSSCEYWTTQTWGSSPGGHSFWDSEPRIWNTSYIIICHHMSSYVIIYHHISSYIIIYHHMMIYIYIIIYHHISSYQRYILNFNSHNSRGTVSISKHCSTWLEHLTDCPLSAVLCHVVSWHAFFNVFEPFVWTESPLKDPRVLMVLGTSSSAQHKH